MDALRGIAAVAVFFFHATMFRPQANYGFFLGITGVDLFFMISGFVIFMSIEAKQNANAFALSRFIRIYPIYWIVATFTFSYYFLFNYYHAPVPYVEISLTDYLVNLSMIQYYFNVPNIDGSYWTLVIELLFYALIYMLYRLKIMHRITTVGAIIIALTLINFYLVSAELLPDFSNWFPLLYHFPLFYIGILFYIIFKKEKTNIILRHILYLRYLLK